MRKFKYRGNYNFILIVSFSSNSNGVTANSATKCLWSLPSRSSAEEALRIGTNSCEAIKGCEKNLRLFHLEILE